jgi:cyanophycin synthetase
VSFVGLAAALASALQDLHGACELPVRVTEPAGGRCRILLGYHDVQTALHALRGGLEIANALFARVGGGPDPRAVVEAVVKRVDRMMALCQPDPIARALIRAARGRGLPVYPLAPGSRLWQYGQGSRSIHCFEAANHQDSPTGARLASDKFMTNVLIRRLGLPGVEHEVVQDLEGARRIAGKFGFPLVVKPIDSGKGRGVTANIRTQETFERAVNRALRDSRRGVLVERFVAGDDHRLSVFGGRLCFASCRSPPRVTGDGVHTIVELIERENARRSDADVKAGFIHRLVIDSDLQETLAGQGLGLADRPEAGRVVALRTIANVATGGTVTDVTDIIHPDNRELAATIARAFRMDVLGIDFMTQDISRSWRDGHCAVLEINATPGFSSDERAQRILEAKFPGGADGRVPSVVLVGVAASALDAVAGQFRAAGLRTGQTDGRRTRLDQDERCLGAEDLPARVMALLLDPACEALVAGASIGELERHGFPIDRCDLAVLADSDDGDDRIERLVRSCAGEVFRIAPGDSPARVIAPALEQLVARRGVSVR